MNGTKSDHKTDSPSSTYNPILEKDMEEEAILKSSENKSKIKERDGADEKMLPKEDTKISANSEIALRDVKIVMNEKNGDAKVDTEEQKNPFGGMTKEELMKFADDPFWVRLRWFLFITFWVLWAAMLVGAIMIIYAAPKCDPPPPRTWWQIGPLAEVNINSAPEQLKSMNKNIKGLIVTYAEDAYIPFDESHEAIKLLKQAKELGTNVIIDLDPSTSQVWFKESENNNTFLDYYIWQKPKYTGDTHQPPNNWMYHNNPSWLFSAKRNQYYYAPLSKPHLNFRNESVVKEFVGVIKKFIDYGASGIRIRNAPLLLVDVKFEDELLNTTKTKNVLDLGKLLLNWKEVIVNMTEDGPLMIAEELGKVQSYQVKDRLVVDLPLLTNIFAKPNATAIATRLNNVFKVDNIIWPLWKEKSSSLPSDVIDIVTNLLPGTILIELNATTDEQLLKIRESPSIMRGNYYFYSVKNNTVFAFVREISGNPGVLVVLNLGDAKVTINVKEDIPILSQLEEVTIQHYSKNYNETDFKDISAKKEASNIPLSRKSVLVLQYVPKKN